MTFYKIFTLASVLLNLWVLKIMWTDSRKINDLNDKIKELEKELKEAKNGREEGRKEN